jgi:polyhydroxyalkanoate synthesis regulator phasin
MGEMRRLRLPATGRLARSMSLPPDRPTEPLRPTPAPRQPVAYEPAPAPAVDVTAVLVRLEDAVNSVRTGLMIVGVIAVAALGVAIYALMKDDDTSSGGGGASNSRVATLEDRVDRLSRQVQDARSSNNSSDDTSALADRVDALERTVKTLADRPQPGDATQAVKELSDRIDDIAGDVEQLKTAQSP